MRVRDALFLIGLAIPANAHADEQPPIDEIVSEWIEMPAHRALIRELTASSAKPAPFATDGCSGGLSDMWQVVSGRMPDFAEVVGEHPPWEDCCVIHDRAYHSIAGASTAEDSFRARLSADKVLRSCVTGSADQHADRLADYYEVTTDFVRAGFAQTANAMFTSVRLAGGPCTALP